MGYKANNGTLEKRQLYYLTMLGELFEIGQAMDEVFLLT